MSPKAIRGSSNEPVVQWQLASDQERLDTSAIGERKGWSANGSAKVFLSETNVNGGDSRPHGSRAQAAVEVETASEPHEGVARDGFDAAWGANADADSAQKIAPRMRKFVKNVASGDFKTLTAAGVAAGYAPSTIENKGRTMLNRSLVRSELTEALQRRGVSYDDVVQPIVDGLKATRSYVDEKKGLIESTVPDHKIRLETHDRAVALFGGIPKVGEATPASGGFNLFIEVEGGEKTVVRAAPDLSAGHPSAQVAIQVHDPTRSTRVGRPPNPALND